MGGASVAAGALKRAESRRASLPTRAHDDNGRRSCCDDVTPKLPFIRAHSHHFTMQTCFCTQLSYFMVVLLQYNECKRLKTLHESHFMTYKHTFHQQDNAASPDIQSPNEDLLDFATGEMWFRYN